MDIDDLDDRPIGEMMDPSFTDEQKAFVLANAFALAKLYGDNPITEAQREEVWKSLEGDPDAVAEVLERLGGAAVKMVILANEIKKISDSTTFTYSEKLAIFTAVQERITLATAKLLP